MRLDQELTRRQLGASALGAAACAVVPESLAAAPTPPRGIGVNVFDLFYGRLFSRDVKRPTERLQVLAGIGLPFVRFAASPFWPVEWKRFYVDNSHQYFDLLDEVFLAAEAAKIQLIPTMFWNPPAVSDLLGEPTGAWADAKSQTRAFMQRYVSEVVGRYARSRSVLAWEFGNEFNSYADIPIATKWWPQISVEMGTPAQRTKGDLLTVEDCVQAYSAFGSAVRKISPSALVSGGSDIPSLASMMKLKAAAEGAGESVLKRSLMSIAPTGIDILSHVLGQI